MIPIELDRFPSSLQVAMESIRIYGAGIDLGVDGKTYEDDLNSLETS
jgi:hypothetical protein